MNIYEIIEADTASFCLANGLIYAPEDPTPDGSDLPERYLLATMISDPDERHYSNRRTTTKYRVQFDLVVPKGDADELPDMFEALENALILAGYLPQGNRRYRVDEVAQKAYTQKDYYKIMRRG